MNFNRILYTFCLNNDTEGVEFILDRYIEKIDEIDVLYSNGWLFKIAISKGNHEICQLLLSFFENKQNPTEEQKEKLRGILEEITSFSEISKEMQLALNNYVQYEEASREECFDEEDNVSFQNWLNSTQSDYFEQKSTTTDGVTESKLIGDSQDAH
jgi:hypothetical protein